MPTAYQLYNRPDPLRDEPEPHSWDGEIARLAALDEMEYLLQCWLDSYGSGLNYWKMSHEAQDGIIELVREQGYREGVKLFLDQTREEPMLGIKRKRWPHLDLIARYRCPGCGDVKEYRVNMRPGYDKDVYPHFYGRPSVLYCKCKARMDYEGFVRRKEDGK